MKKLFAFLLALTVSASMLFAATSGSCGENATFEIINDTLYIKGTGQMSWDSRSSDGAPWYHENYKVVHIEDGITTIYDRAFYGASYLEKLIIPNSVIYIGSDIVEKSKYYNEESNWENGLLYAGDVLLYVNQDAVGDTLTIKDGTRLMVCNSGYAYKINHIIFPSSIKFISESANLFYSYWYQNLSQPTYCGSVLFKCANVEHFDVQVGTTQIAKNALKGSKLKYVSLPLGVKYIEDSAVSWADSINIPSSVELLGEYAVNASKIIYDAISAERLDDYYSRSLFSNVSDFIIGEKVRVLPSGLLANNSKLKEITIPEKVEKATYSFYLCSALERVNYNAIDCDASYMFYQSGSTYPGITATVGSHVRTISRAFNGCSALTSIEIPNSVTSIGDDAFSGCSALTSIEIPNSVTSIGDAAFSGCSGLTSIEIPNSVTSIGYSAFSSCSGLKSVTISNGVTSIGDAAFFGCSGLTSIEIPNSVTSIGDYAFNGCKGLTSVVWNATNCIYLPSYISGNCNPFQNCTQLTSFTFGENVETIPAYLCYGLSKLSSITIPNSVISIGKYAFYYCTSLKQVFNYSMLNIGPSSSDYGYIAYYTDIVYDMLRGRSILKNRPISRSYIYDMDGDGEMEFVGISKRLIRKYSSSGQLIDTVLTTDYSTSYTPQILHANPDGKLDFLYPYENGTYLYESTDTTYLSKTIDYKPSGSTRIFPLDGNLNGRTDLYSYETDGNHYIHYRQSDGSYLKVQLQILTDTAAIDSAIYEQWSNQGDGSSYGNSYYWTSIPSLRDGMFVRAPRRNQTNVVEEDVQPLMLRRVTAASSSGKFSTLDMAIDIDRNGLVDLMSSTTGAILYNLGKNRYVMGEFPGMAIAKDLNGDGILDYVIYNESTKTVYLQIYEGNGQARTQTLMQNLNITNVWCYDFDNDGDVDILLPFDYTTSAGYAYLVFFRNDGNNTFKKVENAFDDPVMHFAFVDCKDVDNDGQYEIIAADSIRGTTFYKGDYYLIRYNNRFKTSVDSAPFVAKSLSGYLPNPDMLIGDFNNDGTLNYWHKNEDYYALCHFVPTTPNTAPAKMNKPKLVLDAGREMLIISWDSGSDAECSSLDLTYSIRIGSASGKSDIWFAAANADGTQRNLLGGNVGAYLNQFVNIAGWKQGDYYIAVQAIDPSGLGGAWSDEAVYHHTLLSANFKTDHNVTTTADTTIICYDGIVDGDITYTWNFGDSEIILVQDIEKQVYKVAWNTAGEKTISLQLTDSAGRKSPLEAQKITVYPIRFDAIGQSPSMSYFDMDMDGVMDGIASSYKINGTSLQGFMRGKGDGTFLKLAKTYNSDLTVNSYYPQLAMYEDVDMDGLPDIQIETNKGNLMYNREDFEVDFENRSSFLKKPFAAPRVDFNNDGIKDTWFKKNNYTIALVINGEQRDTVELRLPTDHPVYTAFVGEDYDNNGYRDIVAQRDRSNEKNYIIYLYDNYQFVCQDAPIWTNSQYNGGSYSSTVSYLNSYPFADLNSDGVPDMNAYQIKSRITNTPPAVPTNLRVVQVEDSVLLQWDAAVDKETPAAQMRYNISVKKKGKSVGDIGAFIVSPMNGLYNESALIPGYPYTYGTTYAVPVNRFTVGEEYEFSIQSIDLWNGHSNMSAPISFQVEQQVSLTMPTEACFNSAVEIYYRGTETSGFSWDFDGGNVISGSDGGPYEVSWATGGVKNVSVTVNGMTATRSIYVKGEQDFSLAFSLPAEVVADTDIPFNLPAQFMNPNTKLRTRTSWNVKSIRQKEGTTTALVRFSYNSNTTENPEPEEAWVEFYYYDDECGEMNNYRAYTQVVGASSTPAISIVTVDAATGKNCVIWDAPDDLPEFVNNIIIYKEEGSTNNWVPQAEMAVDAAQWIDMASDPAVRKNRYRIAYGTTYGYTSDMSAVHSSTHLQMNMGLHGAINLVWTKYEGGTIDNYRILRGTTPDNMTVLETVPGTENTYTDINAPADAYYALEYDNMYFDKWVWIKYAPAANRMPAATATRNGRSNIMTSAESAEVTFAESINICAMERYVGLTSSQTALHLYPEILPAMATYKRVSWKIVSGQELATIDDNGLLTANTDGKNGTLCVRATAVDGSGVSKDRYIEVSGMTKNVPVSQIVIQSLTGDTTLYSARPTLTLQAFVYPTEATNQDVSWTILQGQDRVSIAPNHDMCVASLLNNATDGEVMIAASATDNSGVYGLITLMVDESLTPPEPVYYTIRFLNWDGTVLLSSQVLEGETPFYNGATPTRTEDEQYTYSFNCWSPAIVAAIADADYTATFSSTLRKYTITFLNEDGTVLSSEQWSYGEMPSCAEPTKADDEQYTYTFAGWTPSVVAVIGDATYTATYSSEKRKYTITFLNDDNSVLCADKWEYGATPYCEEPTKADDEQYTYTFAGWTPEIVAVVAEATYTATYTATAKPEGVEDIDAGPAPRKVMIDGVFYILRGDKTYTIQGQQIK